MSSEHPPFYTSEEQKHQILVDEEFSKITARYYDTEAEEPTYEKLKRLKQTHGIGEEALKAAKVEVGSTSPMTTERKFWSSRIDSDPSMPPHDREHTPTVSPGVYEKFTDEQLKQIKANLLDSLTKTLSGMSDEKKYGTEAEPGEADLERISQNLINITLEMQRRVPTEIQEEPSSQNKGEYMPNRLSSDDMRVVIERLPKDQKTILPIYRLSLRMRNRADQTQGEERHSWLDRYALFNDLASYLMVNQSPGWDDIYVDRLRQWHAADHPELNNL